MRFYDPFDAVAFDAAPARNPDEEMASPAAAMIASQRAADAPARRQAPPPPIKRKDAESWDFSSDPMHWARARYGSASAAAATEPKRTRESRRSASSFAKTSQALAQLLRISRRAA